jgi:hypothetical protein
MIIAIRKLRFVELPSGGGGYGTVKIGSEIVSADRFEYLEY